MAVLGAKRPQEKAWHLIVFVLWFVLALPALQDVVYHYGQPISLDPAWRAFVLVLIGVGLVNYLPTRYWPSSMMYGGAQVILLADYFAAARDACRGTGLARPGRHGALRRCRSASTAGLAAPRRSERSARPNCGATFVTPMECSGPRASQCAPKRQGKPAKAQTAASNRTAPLSEQASDSATATVESRRTTERTFVAQSTAVRLTRMDRPASGRRTLRRQEIDRRTTGYHSTSARARAMKRTKLPGSRGSRQLVV